MAVDQRGILALDLATKTGWAFWAPGCEMQGGTYEIPVGAGELGMFGVAYLDWLCRALDLFKPAVVCYEQPILPKFGNLGTLRKLYSLPTVTEMEVKRRNKGKPRAERLDVFEVKAPQARKHFCGRGGGPGIKDHVQAACDQRGWFYFDDNHADALCILDYAAAVLKMPGLPIGTLISQPSG